MCRWVQSTTLIDCGATHNCLGQAFSRKHWLKLIELKQSLRCRLGEGTTKVTHSWDGIVSIDQTSLNTFSCIMNRVSAQGVVLGFGFLKDNNISISFGDRAVIVAGKQVECQTLFLEPN